MATAANHLMNDSVLALDAMASASTSTSTLILQVLLLCAAACLCGAAGLAVASFCATAFRLRAFPGPVAFPVVGNLYDLGALKVRPLRGLVV